MTESTGIRVELINAPAIMAQRFVRRGAEAMELLGKDDSPQKPVAARVPKG